MVRDARPGRPVRTGLRESFRRRTTQGPDRQGHGPTAGNPAPGRTDGNLDLFWREQIVETLERLHEKTGQTILLVCHELEAIPPCCRRLLVLRDGGFCRRSAGGNDDFPHDRRFVRDPAEAAADREPRLTIAGGRTLALRGPLAPLFGEAAA